MTLLYIRDIETITGGPEAYENSDCYKRVSWLLAVVSLVGLIFHLVLRNICDRHFKLFMNDEVTFRYIVSAVCMYICMYPDLGYEEVQSSIAGLALK